jgi:tetratricopeptide (TPR) repeat protein
MRARTFRIASQTAVALLLSSALPAIAAPTTFSKDVAPLLFAHCATCHRPGGASSTVLLTYQNARTHARQIVEMTKSRVMPPWQPEDARNVFEGDRRLSDGQIEVFRRWLEDGLLEGDQAGLPPPPSFPSDWELGPPDLVLTMPAYSLRADGPDMFRNFVLPVPLERMRYVRAWEFRPGNARVVHHATMQVDTTGSSSRYDENDKEAGYEGLIAPSARAPDGFFLDWAPGHRPAVAVKGTAWPLPPSSDLVLMLHMRPSGRVEQVQASLALYFGDTPPERVPVMLRLTRQDLDIPAGAERHVVTDRYVVPVDVDLYTVQPHAHYVAHEISGVAQLPEGAMVPLISIPRWDFNWQDVYHYTRPVRLTAGSVITMTITYDNTSRNPRNPHSPPVRVGYGQQTSDEMAELWFQVLAVRPEDRQKLVESVQRKILPEEIKGRRAMLRVDPANVALHDDVALMLVETGDLAGAEREFRASLDLRPDSAAARFNVGMARLSQGDRPSAREWFGRALQADPLHGPTHFQLGLLQQNEGDLRGASQHFAAALAARPRDADLLLASGVVSALVGEDAAAIQRLRGALEVRPAWANAEAALASVLSTAAGRSGLERREAVDLAQRANARTGRRNAAFLDILAGALAATGDFKTAVATEREALALADTETAAPMRARLEEWEKRAR